jgi:hypothetical protein
MSSSLPMAMEAYSSCAQPTVTYISDIVSSKKKRRHRPLARRRASCLLGPELHSSFVVWEHEDEHIYAPNAERTLSSHARVAAVPRDEQIPTTVDLPTRRDDTHPRTQRIQPQVDDFSSVCQLPAPCHGRSS